MVDRTKGERDLWQKLVTGWQWMKRNPTSPQIHDFFNRWLVLLEDYTGRFGMIGGDGPVPPPSLWRSEAATQLGIDLGESHSAAIRGPSATKPRSSRKYISER